MKKLIIIALSVLSCLGAGAQTKKNVAAKQAAPNAALLQLTDYILLAQANAGLFTANLEHKSQEQDVNTIIKDIQKYIDSMPATRTRADVLLVKNYTPLRSYYLTTSNKTALATSFLYAETPYKYAEHNGSTALYIGAVKCGEIYSLDMNTEGKVTRTVLTDCLLPSLMALKEFKDTDIGYVGLSVYYGTRDSRDGAPSSVMPYCLTLVARMADVQEYAAGMLTAKGLLSRGELYQGGAEDYANLKKINVNMSEGEETVEALPARRKVIGPLPDGAAILMEVK